MGRRSIIQAIFQVIRDFFSRVRERPWTSGEVIIIALLILIVITTAILFAAFISKRRRKKEYR